MCVFRAHTGRGIGYSPPGPSATSVQAREYKPATFGDLLQPGTVEWELMRRQAREEERAWTNRAPVPEREAPLPEFPVPHPLLHPWRVFAGWMGRKLRTALESKMMPLVGFRKPMHHNPSVLLRWLLHRFLYILHDALKELLGLSLNIKVNLLWLPRFTNPSGEFQIVFCHD